uniref:Uncharacterized protein n=1 Tax=Anguilla anguilla TaxID=7936 RepID=A0A0E9XLF8_ANGAN
MVTFRKPQLKFHNSSVTVCYCCNFNIATC